MALFNTRQFLQGFGKDTGLIGDNAIKFKNKIKTKYEVISVFSNKDIQKVKKLLIKNVN